MRHVLAQLVWAATVATVWTGSPICSAEAAQRRLATFCGDVTPPLGQPILGDVLLIGAKQIGGQQDQNRIFYFDLPQSP